MRKIADVPVATTPVSLRPAQMTTVFDAATRIVIGALGVAFIFLIARIIGKF